MTWAQFNKWKAGLTCIIAMLTFATATQAADRQVFYSLDQTTGLRMQKVSAIPVEFQGNKALKVELLPQVALGKAGVDFSDRDTFAVIPGTDGFRNGVIEVDVIGKLSPTAPPDSRAFLGVAFRISNDISAFEALYIRPTNSRADDQVRRNHTLQYFAFPDYPFKRFRKEAPERYESYADLDMNSWTHMRIEVKDDKAKLYINGAKQPSLIVNDLKLGPEAKGSIGLWTEIGTIAYFSNLKVTYE